jgi:hypothetical protein
MIDWNSLFDSAIQLAFRGPRKFAQIELWCRDEAGQRPGFRLGSKGDRRFLRFNVD